MSTPSASATAFTTAFVGLGGNLGDPVVRIRAALKALGGRADTEVALVSSLYRNPPMGPPGQPDYVNGVAALRTRLGPVALLDVLQDLEHAAGRVRGAQRWQARTLDLDLLLYDALCLDTPRLTLPHPGVHERAFVIHPLAEIAPDAIVPGHGCAQALAGSVSPAALERVCGPVPCNA